MSPNLEREASYPGEVPAEQRSGREGNRLRGPGSVGTQRHPKAEVDASGCGVSGDAAAGE